MENHSHSQLIDFNPTSLDIILAIITAIFLPFLTYFLESYVGAFLPLLLYYGIFCFLLVKWRKKSLQYHLPFKINYKYFSFFFIFEIFLFLISTQTYKFTNNYLH